MIPQLSLTGGALAGAAVGTAVLPGVGTAIGARIGQQLEKLFGDGDEEKARRPEPRRRRSRAEPPARSMRRARVAMQQSRRLDLPTCQR